MSMVTLAIIVWSLTVGLALGFYLAEKPARAVLQAQHDRDIAEVNARLDHTRDLLKDAAEVILAVRSVLETGRQRLAAQVHPVDRPRLDAREVAAKNRPGRAPRFAAAVLAPFPVATRALSPRTGATPPASVATRRMPTVYQPSRSSASDPQHGQRREQPGHAERGLCAHTCPPTRFSCHALTRSMPAKQTLLGGLCQRR